MVYRIAVSLGMVAVLSSCIFLSFPERKIKGEELYLKEIKELSESRLYEEAIQKCQEFKEDFPKSSSYDVVLLKEGEAYERLLEKEYHELVEDGQPEEAVRKSFLERFGYYQCWVEDARGIHYNLSHYKEMMEKFPDSRYADEGEYHLIHQVVSYRGLPDGPLQELKDLESILQKYPTTSLRPEIYYQIANRLHILYEIYAFSPRMDLRNEDEAQKHKEKAFYFYRLVLQQPEQSKFSRHAWEGLKNLEEGRRIYHNQ